MGMVMRSRMRAVMERRILFVSLWRLVVAVDESLKMKEQIPFGDDNQKDKGNGKAKSKNAGVPPLPLDCARGSVGMTLFFLRVSSFEERANGNDPGVRFLVWRGR